MDSLIAAAARALAAGDLLGALKRVSLREDPPALALRGIAMAQLGDLQRARELLRQAARAFGPREAVARARCTVAECEVALALRELGDDARALPAAAAVLQAHGDHANAQQARLIAVRRCLLLGRLDAARQALDGLQGQALPAPLAAMAHLAAAELALRTLRIPAAEALLRQAGLAAQDAGVPALQAEVAHAGAALQRPAARIGAGGSAQVARLQDVAALLASGALVVDACARGVRRGEAWLPLAGRPVLFTLCRLLAEAWPADAERHALIAGAFRTRHPDETHRARLRVELGRLRSLLAPLAGIAATPRGFALRPHDGRPVVLLLPPMDGDPGALLALLADGAAWSTSALAQALGSSQRTVQRALVALAGEGRVRAIGDGRARRWLAPPLAGFTTILLLPTALAPG